MHATIMSHYEDVAVHELLNRYLPIQIQVLKPYHELGERMSVKPLYTFGTRGDRIQAEELGLVFRNRIAMCVPRLI